jgi:magnesium chelatase subunit I
MPLDIQFVFTANPEDYTNRGAIITPLKDRIESQILTHYPNSIEISKRITAQEASIHPDQLALVKVSEIAEYLIETIAFEARKSEYVDQKSGVSARMTITALENLVSSAERRALINNESLTYVRMADFWGVIPSITGKVELVYEGEQEGPFIVALNLIGKAVRSIFTEYFPEPEQAKKRLKKKDEGKSASTNSIYASIVEWFNNGNNVDITNDLKEADYRKVLEQVPGLRDLVSERFPNTPVDEQYFLMEFLLHGLSEYSQLNKQVLSTGVLFKDLFSSMFSGSDLGNLDEEEDGFEDDY